MGLHFLHCHARSADLGPTGPVTAAATAPAAIRLRGGSDHQAAHQGSDHNCNQSPLATTLAGHRNHCAP
jgi:hypothetical protein